MAPALTMSSSVALMPPPNSSMTTMEIPAFQNYEEGEEVMEDEYDEEYYYDNEDEMYLDETASDLLEEYTVDDEGSYITVKCLSTIVEETDFDLTQEEDTICSASIDSFIGRSGGNVGSADVVEGMTDEDDNDQNSEGGPFPRSSTSAENDAMHSMLPPVSSSAFSASTGQLPSMVIFSPRPSTDRKSTKHQEAQVGQGETNSDAEDHGAGNSWDDAAVVNQLPSDATNSSSMPTFDFNDSRRRLEYMLARKSLKRALQRRNEKEVLPFVNTAFDGSRRHSDYVLARKQFKESMELAKPPHQYDGGLRRRISFNLTQKQLKETMERTMAQRQNLDKESPALADNDARMRNFEMSRKLLQQNLAQSYVSHQTQAEEAAGKALGVSSQNSSSQPSPPQLPTTNGKKEKAEKTTRRTKSKKKSSSSSAASSSSKRSSRSTKSDGSAKDKSTSRRRKSHKNSGSSQSPSELENASPDSNAGNVVNSRMGDNQDVVGDPGVQGSTEVENSPSVHTSIENHSDEAEKRRRVRRLKKNDPRKNLQKALSNRRLSESSSSIDGDKDRMPTSSIQSTDHSKTPNGDKVGKEKGTKQRRRVIAKKDASTGGGLRHLQETLDPTPNSPNSNSPNSPRRPRRKLSKSLVIDQTKTKELSTKKAASSVATAMMLLEQGEQTTERTSEQCLPGSLSSSHALPHSPVGTLQPVKRVDRGNGGDRGFRGFLQRTLSGRKLSNSDEGKPIEASATSSGGLRLMLQKSLSGRNLSSTGVNGKDEGKKDDADRCMSLVPEMSDQGEPRRRGRSRSVSRLRERLQKTLSGRNLANGEGGKDFGHSVASHAASPAAVMVKESRRGRSRSLNRLRKRIQRSLSGRNLKGEGDEHEQMIRLSTATDSSSDQEGGFERLPRSVSSEDGESMNSKASADHPRSLVPPEGPSAPFAQLKLQNPERPSLAGLQHVQMYVNLIKPEVESSASPFVDEKPKIPSRALSDSEDSELLGSDVSVDESQEPISLPGPRPDEPPVYPRITKGSSFRKRLIKTMSGRSISRADDDSIESEGPDREKELPSSRFALTKAKSSGNLGPSGNLRQTMRKTGSFRKSSEDDDIRKVSLVQLKGASCRSMPASALPGQIVPSSNDKEQPSTRSARSEGAVARKLSKRKSSGNLRQMIRKTGSFRKSKIKDDDQGTASLVPLKPASSHAKSKMSTNEKEQPSSSRKVSKAKSSGNLRQMMRRAGSFRKNGVKENEVDKMSLVPLKPGDGDDKRGKLASVQRGGGSKSGERLRRIIRRTFSGRTAN